MISALVKSLVFISIITLPLPALDKQINCEHSVKDILKKDVCIPSKIERVIITCYGGASQEIALFMGANKIVAHPDVSRFKFFLNLYPQLKNVPSVGTFNDVNLETILKLKPDIVFAGITSIVTNDRIKAFDIPVFTLGIGKHNIQTLLAEFEDVGEILHEKQKAKDLLVYWQEKLNLIKQRVSTVENLKPRTVFYSNSSNALSSDNKGLWGDEFIRASGGVNVASQMKVKGIISSETLSMWNPDVIITSTNKNLKTSKEKILTNEVYKNLQAVKNREVYAAPVGSFWWDRPSPESILGILWLSKILYPQIMSDIDLKKETKYFYKRFYNYDLLDEEYELFFATKEKKVNLKKESNR